MLKNVLVVGTGTIGEPLIGLLSDFKEELGIRVFFHNAPTRGKSKVNSLSNEAQSWLLIKTSKGHSRVLVIKQQPPLV